MSLLSEAVSSAITGYSMEGLLFRVSDGVSDAASSDAGGVNDGDSSIPFHDFAAATSGNIEAPHYQQQQMTAATLMIVLALSEIFVIVICRMLSNYHDAFYSQYRAEDLAFFLSMMGDPMMNVPGRTNDPIKRKEVVESVLVHEMFHRRRKTKHSALKEKLDQNSSCVENEKKQKATARLSLTCFECDDALEESCPICLVDYDEGDGTCHTQSCGHCFHADCLKTWLMNHDTCPCCRTDAFSTCTQKEEANSNNNSENEPNGTAAAGESTVPVSEEVQSESVDDAGAAAPEAINTQGQPSQRRRSAVSAFGLPTRTSIIDRSAVTISRQSSFVTSPIIDGEDNSNSNNTGGGLLAAETAAAFDATFLFF